MKATEIHVERTFNTGNYENQKIRIVVSLGEDDTATTALQAARTWLDQHDPNKQEEEERATRNRARLLAIINDVENNSPRRIREAQAELDTLDDPLATVDDGIPF
jgi:hypothetical protein